MRTSTASTFDCPGPGRGRRAGARLRCGFTLPEIVVVVVLVGLLLLMPSLNLLQMVGSKRFKARVGDLVAAFEMAGAAAAESNRRYEIIIDIPEQTYLLREITTPDLSEVLEEEIIREGDFGDNCWVSCVEFDDGDFTNDSRAKFRVGHGGWQYGGKVVLLDENERPYSIVVNRVNRVVSLIDGDAILLMPKTEEEVAF